MFTVGWFSSDPLWSVLGDLRGKGQAGTGLGTSPHQRSVDVSQLLDQPFRVPDRRPDLRRFVLSLAAQKCYPGTQASYRDSHQTAAQRTKKPFAGHVSDENPGREAHEIDRIQDRMDRHVFAQADREYHEGRQN